MSAAGSVSVVKPGIETLRDNGFELLKGKRVGLITNPTGVDNDLKSTIDILHEAPGVNLVALFAPEHGVRGDIPAGQKVAVAKDAVTGVKVHSLYGATRRPTAEMLKDVDVLVYDIQDNGCRSYTFISTMGLAMEQCARLGKEFVVLDRPNPLGGNKVEGPVTDADCRSFVGQYPVPYLYGLTPGELAKMLVGEKMITSDKPLKLTVVPMAGWKRDMLFSDTGMPWVLPSPHIPSSETAIYYPATGIAGELDYLSIGVGYTLPFRTFAAPWINGRKLAGRMNGLKIPGVLFRPVNYRPYYGFSKGVDVGGVEVYVTDFDKAPLTLIQFYVMQELAAMYPAHKMSVGAAQKRFDMFDKVVGTRKLRPLFMKRHRVEDILALWNRDHDTFKARKKKYEIY
jgi:uncharacterized protein YbbC (DUF1343 family)